MFGVKTQKSDFNEKLQAESINKINANFAKAIISEGKKEYFEVDSFLQDINMEKYKDLFIANGFEDLDAILELKDEHFQVMQLPLGHKLKILKKVREIRNDKSGVEDATRSINDEACNTNSPVKKETSTNSEEVFNEEESHNEFLKAREAWLKERQNATEEIKVGTNEVGSNVEEHKIESEVGKGFFADIGGDAWNVPELPEYAEEGTGVSPREKGKKDTTDCCYQCFKFFPQGTGFEDKSIHKTFCDERCFDLYFREYAVDCQNCNKKLLSEGAIFRDRMYLCSEDCYSKVNKGSNSKELVIADEEIDKHMDEMLQLEDI